jgi:hypothetical protein
MGLILAGTSYSGWGDLRGEVGNNSDLIYLMNEISKQSVTFFL